MRRHVTPPLRFREDQGTSLNLRTLLAGPQSGDLVGG